MSDNSTTNIKRIPMDDFDCYTPPYTILVDIDDVIFETSKLLLAKCNELYNTNYKFEDITSFEWFEHTFPKCLLLLNSWYFWHEVEVVPNSIGVIKDLRAIGQNVKFSTNTNCTQLELIFKTQRLLSLFNTPEHTLFTPNDIIVCADKHLLDAAIIIDDKGSTLVECANQFYPQLRFCFTRPWNISEDIENYIDKRIGSWNDFAEYWNTMIVGFIDEMDLDSEPDKFYLAHFYNNWDF